MSIKFQRFLGRISAETCLKMDYFGSKSQKNRQALGFRPLTSVQVKLLENVQIPIPIEISV